uniref:Neprosin PEP catalytic domain-containing protein n=1 Tax=Leersia perrieri TaxID=77586 RepID=A0A0D9XR72_9ORYZ
MTTKIFLLLHFLTLSVEPTTEEIDKILIVKSVQSADGQTYACVNFESQPSLRHPLLMDQTSQLNQTISIPQSVYGDKGYMPYISNVEVSNIECPPGTVPILTSYINGSMSTKSFDKTIGFDENGKDKVSRQAVAVAIVPSTLYGLHSAISIWEPDIGIGKPPRFSGAVALLENEGSHDDPQLYGDNHVHFEIAWVSKRAVPGIIIKPVSMINGEQYIFRVKIVKFLGSSILIVGQEMVGYWPSKLFNYMSGAASRAAWMGSVGAAPGESFPPMGSGQSPDEGERKELSSLMRR